MKSRNDNSYKVGEKMFDENDNEVPMVKYEWRVTMEIPELVFTVQANTAKEAMELSEKIHQLKLMNLDLIPKLVCTSAMISDVTNKFRDHMQEIKGEQR